MEMNMKLKDLLATASKLEKLEKALETNGK